MRRLVCILALLGKLSGQSYVWTARPPQRHVPIEWQVSAAGIAGKLPAWWLGA
jgi:hypothetical protein